MKDLYCHWCRQVAKYTYVKCYLCPLKFCERCLQGKQGEDAKVESQPGVKWICPKCRGGCGPGCYNCCTCSLCRRGQGLVPIGVEPLVSLIKDMSTMGFSNVHDFLIFLKTGDSMEAIASRKDGQGWTKAGSIQKKRRGRPPGSGRKNRSCEVGAGEIINVECTNFVQDELEAHQENMDLFMYPLLHFVDPEKSNHRSNPNVCDEVLGGIDNKACPEICNGIEEESMYGGSDENDDSPRDRRSYRDTYDAVPSENLVGGQYQNNREADPEESLGVRYYENHHSPSADERLDSGSDGNVGLVPEESIDGGSDHQIRNRSPGDSMEGPFDSRIGVNNGDYSRNGGSSPNVRDVRGDGDESTDNESDLKLSEGYIANDTLESGRDPFEDYNNMGFNIFLLKRWFTREKCLVGNKLTITLTGKEVQQAKAIVQRSNGKPIRYNCVRILKMDHRLQESVLEKMCATIRSDYTQMKGRLAEEMECVYDAIVEEVSGADGMD